MPKRTIDEQVEYRGLPQSERCAKRVQYRTQARATKALIALQKVPLPKFNGYHPFQCQHCHFWHLGR